MSDIFLGWDVGAWNCDKNRNSRDALCALELRDGAPAIVGHPWRGNLRDEFVARDGLSLLRVLFERAGAPLRRAHYTIAIDTPLAWPKRTIELIAHGHIAEVPARADRNPYLFRHQEIELFGQGCWPLSTVRDMIGSQSTKGIHFLHRAGLQPAGVGVWADDTGSFTALETYPAAAVRDVEVARLTSQLLADLLNGKRDQSPPWRSDVRDAITCALVAWLHRTNFRLEGPGASADAAEGWIWLPVKINGPA
jgi:hypothetical protein